MQNHLFMLQVHKDPKLMERILHHLAAPNHYFVVNVDAKTKNADDFLKVLESVPNVICISRKNVMHGGFSQIGCTLYQWEQALSYCVDFSYYHTLSGQDYPCVSASVFDRFFEGNTQSYMMMDLPEEVVQWRKKKYKDRLECWNFNDVFHGRLGRKLHIAGLLRRVMKAVPRPYRDMDQIWGAWNWYSLHHTVVKYLMNYFWENPKFVRRFYYTHCCDELFYSTVLYPLREELNIASRNSLRFVVWRPKREYTSLPLVLDEREFDAIAESGCFFCRKVESGVSARLLAMLDAKIAEE